MSDSDWFALGWAGQWATMVLAVAFLIAGIVIEIRERRAL